MPLSPLDIESRRFKRALGGYSKVEVESFLAQVADTLSNVILEKQELAQKVKGLLEELETLRSRENRLMDALSAAERLAEERKALANDEADRLVQDAHRRAEEIIKKTHEKLRRVEDQIARLQIERESFENRLSTLIDDHRRLIEMRREDARRDLQARSAPKPPAGDQRTTQPPPHPLDSE
jgi:cell division initiation protein